MNRRFTGRGHAAFSLVEIALTLGIMAFALVAILGLMSVGINASRDSGDDTKVAFIMQDVAARLRAEVSGVNLIADPTTMDLSWNPAYAHALNYTVLGSTTLPTDPSSGQPQAAASAYYTFDGQFTKQAGATAPTQNFYKASVFVQPLTAYPFPTPTSSSPSDHQLLAVTVRVGWPTDNLVNGNVTGPAAYASKVTATFYLSKP